MGALAPFRFDGHPVRIIDRNGDPWFVAADVCTVLGLANARDAVSKLDEDEKGVASTDTLGGPQQATIISESGLYTIILRCREATTPGSVPHRFRKWVTAEVLPSIRKTGRYGAPAADPMAVLNDPAAMRGLLLTYTEKVIALEGKVQEMTPKVQALERIAETEGSFCITDAAKTLQVNPKVLFRYLRQHGWIYTRAGTSGDVAYQSRLVSGDMEHKTTTVTRADGTEKTVTQARITPKGLTRLAKVLTPVASEVA